MNVENIDARPTTLAAGIASRRAGAEILALCLEDRLPLDQAMAQSENFNALDGRDRAFAHAMAAAALRYLGPIDQGLAALLERPLPPEAEGPRALLRLGAAQLAVLKTPVHAAIGATVEAAKSWRQTFPFAGLINAVLRRFAREKAESVETAPAADFLPDWLGLRWRTNFGEDFEAIVRTQTREAPIDVTLRRPEEAARWAAQWDATILPSQTLRLKPDCGPVDSLAGFASGEFWVQDAAAGLPALLLNARKGERIADLCAAPGGKTLQMAAAGAEVTAIDRSRERLGRLRDNLARTGLSARLIAADAAGFSAAQRFDAVLLDAPCLATGTIRRHPEAPWIKAAADLPGLMAAQRALIANAVRLLAPGGRLIYCVCSREPEEGREQIAWALQQDFAAAAGLTHAPFSAAETPWCAGLLDGQGALDLNRPIRSGPWSTAALEAGLDGFFAARLVRRA